MEENQPNYQQEEYKDDYNNQYDNNNNQYQDNNENIHNYQNDYQNNHQNQEPDYNNHNQEQLNNQQYQQQDNQEHFNDNANGFQVQQNNIHQNVIDDGVNLEDVPIEMQEYDQNKKDMYSYMSMGFDKKFRDLNPKAQKINIQTPQDGQTNDENTLNPNLLQKPEQKYGSLDAKAYLITPPKALSYYQTKGEATFFDQNQIDNGRPIQMIYTDPETGKWQLSEEANLKLMQAQGPISFISIVGQQFSGKTFLMNQLLKTTQNQRFTSGQPDDLSTKGIIMWSEPTYNPQTNSYIFFIDTQEFKTEEGRQRDVREQLQFFITTLISQTMLVNVVGDLGDNSLVPLQDISDLGEFIQLETIEQKEELGNIFPRILYVLRDNKHIVQEKGSAVAMHTYLDNFLFSDEKYKKASPIEQKIRRRIIKYFRNRDAISMVTPVNDQQLLDDLDNVKEQDLSEDFQEELKALRKKIIYHARKKEFRGVFITPTMTVSFINSILDDLNSKQKIDLNKAFAIILENEFIYIYNFCLEQYTEYISTAFADMNFKSFHDLHKILRTARDQCFKSFYQLKAHDIPLGQQFFDEYLERLEAFLEAKEQNIQKLNSQNQLEAMQQLTNDTLQQTRNATSNSKFSVDDLTKITQDYHHLINQVLLQTQGGDQTTDPLVLTVKQVQEDLQNQFIREIQESNKISSEERKKLQDLQNRSQQQEGQLADKIKNHEKTNRELQQQIANQNQAIQDLKQKNQVQYQKLQQESQKQIQQLKQNIDQLQQELDASKKKQAKCF